MLSVNLLPALFFIQLLFYGFGRTLETTTNVGNPFVWIGCAVFHVAFIPSILTLSVIHWPTGFTMVAFYTANLFALTHRLDNKNNMNHSARLESTFTDDAVRQQKRPSPTLMVTVLYGLALLSLGGTGSLLAMNYRALLGNIACASASSSSSLTTSSDRFDGDCGSWLNVPPTVWTTNVTRLPANVQKWARQQLSSQDKTRTTTTKKADGFVHLPGSGSTIFTEWNNEFLDFEHFWRRKIWTVSSPLPQSRNSRTSVDLHRHHRPVAIHDYAGHDFVVANPHRTCFVTIRSIQSGDIRYRLRRNGDIIACFDDKNDSDGTWGKTRRYRRLRFTKRNARGRQYRSRLPRDLIVVPVVADATAVGANAGPKEGTMMIWYLDDPPDRSEWGPSEQLVYSLDPTTMIETLHSEPLENDQRATGDSTCPKQQEHKCLRRAHALVWLWLCALPLTVTSIYLWYHRQVSSMGLTTFGGFSSVGLSLYWLWYGVAPPWQPQSLLASWSLWLDHDPTRHFIQWWMLIFGAIWTVFSINGLLVSSSSSVPQQQQPQQGRRELYKDPMWWGLHIGSLSCFVAMRAIMIELIPDDVGTVVGWALVHALILVPMFVLGLAAQMPLLQALTAIGILWMDSTHMFVAFFSSRLLLSQPRPRPSNDWLRPSHDWLDHGRRRWVAVSPTRRNCSLFLQYIATVRVAAAASASNRNNKGR